MDKAVFTALLSFLYFQNFAQSIGWQNKDLKMDSVFGISVEKAYTQVPKKKKPTAVLVSVIDSGIDTLHEDLNKMLWNNPKELLNGVDDDRNGYADDIHGWSFIGGKDRNVQYDNLELVRIIRRDKGFYDSLSIILVPEKYRKDYVNHRKMLSEYYWQLSLATKELKEEKDEMNMIERVEKNGKGWQLTATDFENYQAVSYMEDKLRQALISRLKAGMSYESLRKIISNSFEHFYKKVNYHLNLNYDPRFLVGDDYANSNQKNYGNNDVQGPNATHGTHVAGIIAAIRNNGIGVGGIAENITIMAIRVVPDGDERDKDVANGIRYAVDNGAKIINMSFGKSYSWDKKCVDDAVKYAMSKDVLIVHAAGNAGKDLDGTDNFPNRRYSNSSGEAKAWIEVGASDKNGKAANFSNYGKANVDVFSPGVQIYSAIPGNKYESNDGTSMAAPVVSGLAALVWGYYPKLTAVQIKEIIMKSVVKRDVLKDKCVSGGIVNAYNALKLAASYK